MKQLFLLLVMIVMTSVTNAQTYYYMWRGYGDSGKPEWIANSEMGCGFTGIQFNTANKFRSCLTGYGRWLFFDPLDENTSKAHIQLLSNSLNEIGNSAAGTQGYMAAKRWVVTDLTKSISTGGYYGYGRNNDVTLSSGSNKWLRLTSGGGIAFWGQGGGESDDSPQFEIRGEEINCNKRFNFRDNNNSNRASLMLGRNYDVTFWVTPEKWLRVLSPAGIGLWMNNGGETDDSPQILLGGTHAEFKIPILQRNGAFTHTQNNITTQMGLNGPTTAAWLGTTSHHGIELGTNGTAALYIGNEQNIFMGFDKVQADSIRDTLKNKYRVFVKKGVLSEDYAIAPVSSWADFVFSSDYKLRPISEVENFISENSHLPDVPSAENVSTEGYSQHDMNKVLLQKIEELTLYIIQQDKEIQLLKSEMKK